MKCYNSPIDDSEDIPWCRNYLKMFFMSMFHCLADLSTTIVVVPKLQAVEGSNLCKYIFTCSDCKIINRELIGTQ